jgi:hypothetical protein
MTNHHPTWSEIRTSYLSDPDVAGSFEELREHFTEPYAPAPRNRSSERLRLEETCPGYREERERLAAGEDDDA